MSSSLIKYFNYYLQLYIAIWQGRCLKRIQNKSFLFLLILSRVRRSVKPFLFIKLYTNANIKDGWILKPTIRQKSCIKRKSILTCKVKRVKARIRNIYNLSNYLLYLLLCVNAFLQDSFYRENFLYFQNETQTIKVLQDPII